jgi:hypothetical protein
MGTDKLSRSNIKTQENSIPWLLRNYYGQKWTGGENRQRKIKIQSSEKKEP